MEHPNTIINTRKVFEHVFVIDLVGELTSKTTPALMDAYQQASKDGARALILNFRHLTYKDSSGIKLLVALLMHTDAAQQHLFFVELSEDHQNILRVAQLIEGITAFALEADALQAARELLDAPGRPPAALPPEAFPGQPSASRRFFDTWAKPVDLLRIAEIPAGALALNVDGRPLFGPLQGFGQLWQKTYRIRLRDNELTPHEIITAWKQHLPRLKPPGQRFYPSTIGIAPNALVLIDANTPGGPISTGVMVLYAGAEAFTLITPAGHPEAGWITFSSYVEDGSTYAQVQIVACASDPLYEMAFRLIGSRLQNRIWMHVLMALAAELGISGEIQQHATLLSPKLQWRHARNIWYNAQIRTLLYCPIALVSQIGAWFKAQRRRTAA
jgi:anti-anti-sigma factor